MNFDLSTESGIYGGQEGPSEQYFRVNAQRQDFEIVFEKALNSTYDMTVKRPVDLGADEFMENLRQDPEVYPNSDVTVVPNFPIGDDNFEETTLMMYGARPLEERQDYAIVDVSLEEQMGDEKIRWVNKEKAPEQSVYPNKLWYIGTDLRERPVVDHLSQDPVTEDELSDLLEEAEALIENHSFQRI